MGVVITVMNMKGGVGKTTVAMHLAGMAAMYLLGSETPRKVLAIDYDPQFNMSQAFLAAKSYFKLEEQRRTTISILIDDDTNLDPYQLQVPGNHKPPKVSDICTPRVGVSIEESQIRSNKAFSKHCMTNTLKQYKAFSEPEGGRGFVWFSKKPYSTEAFRNMLQVSQELMTRTGA